MHVKSTIFGEIGGILLHIYRMLSYHKRRWLKEVGIERTVNAGGTEMYCRRQATGDERKIWGRGMERQRQDKDEREM
jgi:hypothetical protein